MSSQLGRPGPVDRSRSTCAWSSSSWPVGPTPSRWPVGSSSGSSALRPRSPGRRSSAIATPDLGAVARAFGCRGAQARTLDEVQAGIDEFLAGDGPMVLDIRVSRSVVSVPYSRLWFGEDV